MKKRYRLYVDESGDSGTSQKSLRQDRYLTLLGVAFEAEYYRDVFQPELETLKKRYLSYDPDDPPILHKEDIVKKTKGFGVLRDPKCRAAFDRDLLTLIQSADFCLFVVVIDKQENMRRYGQFCPDQYGYALAGLIARYAGWLHYAVDGVGDVMAEARYKKADRNLGEVYRQIWQYGTAMYPGPKPVPAERIQQRLTSKELKLKEKNRNIAGLQLADLLTYCCKVDTLRAYGRTAPSLGPYSCLVLAAVQPKYNRNVYTGVVEGYGRILIPAK